MGLGSIFHDENVIQMYTLLRSGSITNTYVLLKQVIMKHCSESKIPLKNTILEQIDNHV